MNKIDKLLWQARMQKTKNWLEAKRLLEDGIKEFPETEKLHTALAELFASKSLHKKAIKHYHKALSFNKNNDTILFRMANCFLTINEYKLALDYYTRIEDVFPEMSYNKAYAYSKIGRVDLSILLLEEMQKYNLQSEIPLLFLSELYFSQKDYKNTLFYLNKVEAKFGAIPSLFYLRGLTYSHLNNWLKAYMDFHKAYDMKFRTINFHKNFGTVCQKIGRNYEAITHFQKGIKEDPDNATGYIELLRLYVDYDMMNEAYKLVKIARKTVPFSLTLTLLYSQIIERMKHKDWEKSLPDEENMDDDKTEK